MSNLCKNEKFAELLPIDLDAALITSDVNRRYFTGMKSSAGIVLITRERSYLLIDFRYYERACKETVGYEVVLLKKLDEQLIELVKKHNIKKIGIESATLTVYELASYRNKLAPIEVVGSNAVSDIISAMRIIKSPEELNKVMAAQSIAERAFEHILSFVAAGKTEREVALEIDYFMLREGAEAISFDTIAVSGKKSSLPHGVPDDKLLEIGDFLTLDFGAVVDGYHSDMTRTIAIGQTTEEMRRVYETVLVAQESALAAAKAGITGKELDSAARDIIANAGFGENFGHGLGHGVGLEIHEAPNASPKGETILKSGMVVTVEPGIYLAGKFGVRIEDMVVIKDDGATNLTSCQKNLITV